MLAAKTTVPVLGVPVPSRHLQGQDSLLSIVQMPAGVPVATFAIGEAGATNAALFAVALLAADDADLAAALDADRGATRHDRAPRSSTLPAAGGVTRSPRAVIVPPATIGVLGGGQLGRYTVVAARLMGYGTVVLDPDPAAPAGRVADDHLVAPYDDPAALDRLAGTLRGRHDRVREPAGGGARAARRRRASSPRRRRPWRSPRTASAEKRFLRRHRRADGAVRRARRRRPTVSAPGDRQDGPPRLRRQGPASPSTTAAALTAALAELGRAVRRRAAGPARRRGQRRRRPHGRRRTRRPTRSPRTTTSTASSTSPSCRRGSPPALAAEAVGAGRADRRAPSTTSACWPSRCSSATARCSSTSWPRARTTAATGRSTPPCTSQFEQQVRAVCGLALGRTDDDRPARWRWSTCSATCGTAASPTGRAALADPDARLHLYGKSRAAPGPQDGPPHGARRRRRRRSPTAAVALRAGLSHVDADELPDGVGDGAGAEDDQHLAHDRAGDRPVGEPADQRADGGRGDDADDAPRPPSAPSPTPTPATAAPAAGRRTGSTPATRPRPATATAGCPGRRRARPGRARRAPPPGGASRRPPPARACSGAIPSASYIPASSSVSAVGWCAARGARSRARARSARSAPTR